MPDGTGTRAATPSGSDRPAGAATHRPTTDPATIDTAAPDRLVERLCRRMANRGTRQSLLGRLGTRALAMAGHSQRPD